MEKARAELAQSRVMLAQALDLARAGDREQAYAVARSAYLDHFEFAEVPLRLRAPNLTLDLEFKYATLRNDIKGGEPVSKLEADVRGIRAGLDDANRAMSSTGIGAPLIAFAVLVQHPLPRRRRGRAADRHPARLARRRSGAELPPAAHVGRRRGAVRDGPDLGARDVPDRHRPGQPGAARGHHRDRRDRRARAGQLLADLRLEHRHWMEFMRARVAAAIATGSAIAFAGLGFTAVYREGFETVLFYQALGFFAEGLEVWVILGAVVALLALGAVGFAVLKLGRRLPLKPMLIGSATLLLVLSVALVGNAVRALQEADKIAVTPVASSLARPPIYVAELTGIHPTQQGLFAQLILLLIYVAGVLYVFGWRPSRRRQRRR